MPVIIPDHTISEFHGINTEISDIKTIKDGWSPDALNFLTGTEQDCIIARRGSKLLGQTSVDGAGKITGLGVGMRADGREVPFFSYGRLVKYYNIDIDDTVEASLAGSTPVLPAAADGDDVSIFPYQNLAGSFAYLTSKNSSVYKIPVANPGTVVDQNQTEYKGFIKFGQTRSILIGRKGSNGFQDVTNLYMSYVDAVELGNTDPFALVSAEQVGAAGSAAYSFNLATVTAPKTATQVIIYEAGAIGTVTFTGGGLNDMTAGGGNTDFSAHVYEIEIDATGTPDTFKWRVDGGSYTNGVSITGAAQTLSNGVTVTFGATTGHTLTNKWNFTASAPGEKFLDDKNGGLLSNLNSTGTVNYGNGAVTVTFAGVTGRNVYAKYYTENATSHGVIDYSFAASRVPGSGRFYSQYDGGGPIRTVHSLSNIFYSFHDLRVWQTSIPTDDDDEGPTAGFNLPYRDRMGIQSPYGAFSTTDGIYFVNSAEESRPGVYLIYTIPGGSTASVAIPKLVSEALNLSSYSFDKAVVRKWGIYVLVSLQQIRNGTTDAFNSRMLVYNTKSKTWDLLDYAASRLDEYGGTLLAGDSLTNNVFTLFSGFDDDGSTYPCYWTSGMTNHGVRGRKLHNRMVVDGLIQAPQTIAVDLAYDGGDFSNVFNIEGTGSYVDSGKSIAVGSQVLGSKIVGGGATVYANPFQVEFRVNTSKYEYVRVRFRTLGGGYTQINYYTFKDIRYKGQRVMPVRTVN